MATRPKTIALLMAAGRGERTGGDTPKQFAMLGGKPMIVHAFAALTGHAAIDEVVVVVGKDQRAIAERVLGAARLVVGGATRQQSVAAGLAAAQDRGAERVLVHDAARPLLPGAVIDRLVSALDTHDGAVPVLPVADTMARNDGVLGEVVPREGVVRVQTPQAFHVPMLAEAHCAWTGDAATDDAQMVRRLGGSIALVQGDAVLDKVTFADDLATAEARLGAAAETRTATGFDVHRLESGEELWLGGVLIPHDKGLSGHSDADVALHAITDALLGTIAAGDIGTHFPPSDPQWRGAASSQFLEHAAGLVAEAGGSIVFVDLTLICEEPKIGPHRASIRTRIADLLQLPPARVSVKATTTERLGFTGRGEGIAAQAVATVRMSRITA